MTTHPSTPPPLPTLGAATTRAELQEEIKGFLRSALASTGDTLTLGVDTVRGFIEASIDGTVTHRLEDPFLVKEFGTNPYSPDLERVEHARHEDEMNRSVVDMVREALDAEELSAVADPWDGRVFTQHRWDQPETRFSVDVGE